MCMMAKKKKGPAADALAKLEALEADLDEPVAVVEERPSLPPKKAKKKKGAKGPAADALAALEELEAGFDAPDAVSAQHGKLQ